MTVSTVPVGEITTNNIVSNDIISFRNITIPATVVEARKVIVPLSIIIDSLEDLSQDELKGLASVILQSIGDAQEKERQETEKHEASLTLNEVRGTW